MIQRIKPTYFGRTNTNNVNICVNVNKSDSESISNLQDKITSLTADLNLLKNNVDNSTSIERFEQNLDQYFNVTERERIKTLINNQSYEILSSYISEYDNFNNLINSGGKVKYKETTVYLNEFSSLSSTLITAQVGDETYTLNDITNSDNDEDTLYKIPIAGFIIGIEIYCSQDPDSRRETFSGIKTSYESASKISYIYLTHDDYTLVYNRGPNNKLQVYSLTVE